jgi:RNA polymerase sigma factor (sigma-70 family)
MSPGIPTRLLATQSDERLLALARDGHERAFEALVLRYRRPLLSYCRRLSLPEARVEDVLQQALLKTWIALRADAEVRDIKAWLYRVVHNTAVNAMRDAARERERLSDPTLRVGGGAAPGDLERGLLMRQTLGEIAALPDLQREVIVRTAVGGHSHERVASDLGITDGAVRGLLYRARSTLRAAATALTPPPLLGWLAGRAEQGGPAPEALGGLAGGGAAGLGGLLLKGGVVAITAGTLITGAVVHIQDSAHHAHHRSPGERASTSAAASQSGAASASDDASRQSTSAVSERSRISLRAPRHRADAGPMRRVALAGAGAPSVRREAGRRTVSTAPRGEEGSPTAARPVASTEPSSGSIQGSQTVASSGQGATTGQSGGGAASQGEPVGSAAGSGSAGGSSGAAGSPETGSAPASGEGSGESSQDGAGEATGSGSSGSSGSESSGSDGSESGSDAGSGQSEGGLVGTVVHEVGGLLEHLLH